LSHQHISLWPSHSVDMNVGSLQHTSLWSLEGSTRYGCKVPIMIIKQPVMLRWIWLCQSHVHYNFFTCFGYDFNTVVLVVSQLWQK
jgi:hypothetical protein